MSVVIPDGFAHIIHRFTNLATGKVSSVTYGVKVEPLADLEDLATEVDTAWRTAFNAASFDTSARLEPAIAYVRVGTDLFLVESTLAALAGTTSIVAPPPQVSIVIRKRTQFVGKSQRGRIFLPQWFVGEGSIGEDGILTPTVVTAMQGRADNLLVQLEAAATVTDGMWLLHGNSVNTPDLVTAMVVQPIVRTQRRRLPRG